MREGHRSSTGKVEIFHIISGDLWGGAEAQVFQTLTHLTPPWENRTIALLFNDGPLKRRLDASGVRTILIDENKHGPWGIIRELSRLMRAFDPGIVHVHAYKEHVLGQLALYLSGGSRNVFRTFHGITAIPKGIPLFRRLKSVVVHRVEKFFLNHEGINIIAVSQDLEGFLIKKFPRARVTQIYNSIRYPLEKEYDEGGVRERFTVGKRTLWIGTLARLVEVKNLPLLIDVAQYLKSLDVDFVVSIFGDGPLRGSLQRRIDAGGLNDCVRLEGFNADILAIVKKFDIFAITSFHEGLPMSLLEAMAVGTPVISTDVGGISEVIVDGESGLLVRGMDPAVFGDKIMRLYEDTDMRIRISENGQRVVRERFDILKNNRLLENLYGEVLP